MPSEYKKYYKVLDLDVGNFKEEVNKAWRELFQIYHPGNCFRKSPGGENRSEEKFKELSNVLWTATIISTAKLTVSEQ